MKSLLVFSYSDTSINYSNSLVPLPFLLCRSIIILGNIIKWKSWSYMNNHNGGNDHFRQCDHTIKFIYSFWFILTQHLSHYVAVYYNFKCFLHSLSFASIHSDYSPWIEENGRDEKICRIEESHRLVHS